MTDQELSTLEPAFAAYLRGFHPCFLQDRTTVRFDSYCRALLSDLPRKSAEPLGRWSSDAQRWSTTSGWRSRKRG
jgi:SRSO17 transposase